MPTTPKPVSGIDALSPRRRELLQLLAKGLTNDEIATAMGISAGTVRSHVTTLLSQLDVSNRTEAAAVFVSWEAQPAKVESVMQRPAIAVLPIVAHGGDEHVRVMAAGLTEDLASLFSRWSWFPVIATVASSVARTPGATTDDIAARLGARFLVDGSLRSDGLRCRLSVHVDDQESGHRVWSGQHDFEAGALFDTQDAVSQAIVSAAYPVLVAKALAVVPHARPVTELFAWELAHEGMNLRALREPEANAAAAERFRQALAREPELVLAHFGLGLAAYDAALNQWGSREAALDRLGMAGARCVEYAPQAAEGYFLLGRYLQARGEWDRAVPGLESAIGHNPSFAIAHASLAQSLQVIGRSDEGLARMRHASRLGPNAFVAGLATLHFMRGEYPEALSAADRALLTNPRYSFARGIAAAAAWLGGERERARRHHQALRRTNPPFQVSQFVSIFGAHVESVERFAKALEALDSMR